MARVQRKEELKPIEIKDTHGNITGVWDSDMVEAIKNTVAQDATYAELFMFLTAANKYDLDPFLGEIYYVKFKDKGQIMSGRDGYRKIVMREPTYKVHYSDYVCKNDTFQIKKRMGKLEDIVHEYTHIDRGEVIGAYCVLETTDGRIYSFYAQMKYYNTGKNAWASYPADMIIKAAETRVFKSFANINGIQAEETMPSQYDRETNVDLDEVEMLDVQAAEVIDDVREESNLGADVRESFPE